MIEEPGRSVLDEVRDQLKPVVIAVVGVWNFAVIVLCAEVCELANLGPLLLGPG